MREETHLEILIGRFLAQVLSCCCGPNGLLILDVESLWGQALDSLVWSWWYNYFPFCKSVQRRASAACTWGCRLGWVELSIQFLRHISNIRCFLDHVSWSITRSLTTWSVPTQAFVYLPIATFDKDLLLVLIRICSQDRPYLFFLLLINILIFIYIIDGNLSMVLLLDLRGSHYLYLVDFWDKSTFCVLLRWSDFSISLRTKVRCSDSEAFKILHCLASRAMLIWHSKIRRWRLVKAEKHTYFILLSISSQWEIFIISVNNILQIFKITRFFTISNWLDWELGHLFAYLKHLCECLSASI